MSPNPPTETIPWTHVAPLSAWTVLAVEAALASFEDGDMGDAAMLAEAMLRHPQISRDLRAFVDQIASRSALPFSVEPSDQGDGRKTPAIAEEVKALWWDAHPEATIASIARDSKMLAVSVGWIEWLKTASKWIPRLHHLPAHGLRFDDHDKTVHYQGGDGVDHLVTPGDGLWFLHMPHGSRSWLMGAIRAAGIPFALDPLTLRAFATYIQRYAIPTLIVYESAAQTDNVEKIGDKTFYAGIAKGMRGGVIRVPLPAEKDVPHADVKWAELISKGDSNFVALLSEIRRRLSLAIGGRDHEKTAALGGDGEANASTQSIEGMASETEKLSTSLRDQVWKPFCRFNYGDEQLAPWGRWKTQTAALDGARATSLDKLGDALEKLEKQGVDTDQILEEAGLKRRAGWKAPELNAPAAVTPEPAPDPANDEDTKKAA